MNAETTKGNETLKKELMSSTEIRCSACGGTGQVGMRYKYNELGERIGNTAIICEHCKGFGFIKVPQ